MMVKHWARYTCGLLLGICVTASQAQLVSTALTDVIKSQGSGTINLLKDVTPAQLEAYRNSNQDAQGKALLVLGIDVNESASGTEKNSSQAVSFLSVTLRVTRAGVTTVYTDYFTETKALLAAAGSTVRTWRYTALGEGGSSRITGSNAVQNKFDSTLSVRVPDNLANASAAVLQIDLLNVNMTLGDPEAFYDFSGGFEDLALLTGADAQFLNVTLPTTTTFRAEAPTVELTNPPPRDPLAIVSWSYFPSATGYYFVAYEDNYPSRGDYDFNDLVVAYRYRVGLNDVGEAVTVVGDSYLVARGASFSHDWHLRLPLPAQAISSSTCQMRTSPADATGQACAVSLTTSAADLTAFANTAAIFHNPVPDPSFPFQVNTARLSAFVPGPHADFRLNFATPQSAASIGTSDPWIYVRDTGQPIHLVDIDSRYRDSAGFPFALRLPPSWRHPYERIDLGTAYPLFKQFVQSGGTLAQNWYDSPASDQVFPLASSWSWAP